MAASSLPGRQFWLKDTDEYDLKSDIGRGRFATVWKAREKVTRKALAVKIFKKLEAPSDEVRRRIHIRVEDLLLQEVLGEVSISRGG